MGIIVTLPPPRRKRVAAASTAIEAQILLFMGVRYVRDFDDSDAVPVVPSILPQQVAVCPPLEIA